MNLDASTTRWCLRVLTCLLCLPLAAHPVSAQDDDVDPIAPDQPGFSTSSGVVGPGTFQIETGVFGATIRRRGHTADLLLTPTLLRYGIGNRFEVRVEGNGFVTARLRSPTGTGQTTSGLAAYSVGGKYHFQDATDRNGNLSLGAVGRLFPPTGSGIVSTQRFTGDFRLLADWNPGPNWTFTPNAGFGVYQDGQSRLFLTPIIAASVSFSGSGRFIPYADFAFTGFENSDSDTAILFDTGASYLLNIDTAIDFEVGPGISGLTSPDWFWAFGISRRFR